MLRNTGKLKPPTAFCIRIDYNPEPPIHLPHAPLWQPQVHSLWLWVCFISSYCRILDSTYERCVCVLRCLVTQSCPTLCDPMDCSPPGSSVHGESPGKNTGVGCHALLQGILDPRIEPRSPTLQVDSLPSEPPGPQIITCIILILIINMREP